MSANEARPLYIGWARTSITPDKPTQLCGQFHERVSTGVHDPVTATAMAIETRDASGSAEQAIIVSCDLVFVPRELHDNLRAAVAHSLPGFDVTKLFLAATHTHTAPNLLDNWWYPPAGPGVMGGAEYMTFLVERLRVMVIEAWNARQPSHVSWVLGRAVVGHNRRVVYADGRALMYGPTDRPEFMCLEGGEDHGLELLYVWDQADKFTGILINIACPSQVVESKNYISADYWTEVRKELAQRYSPDLHLLPLCAAAGDQSPRDLVRRKRGEPDMWDEPGLPEIGRRIANAVDEMLPEAQKETRSSVPFAHVVKELTLPGVVVTQAQAEASRVARDQMLTRQPFAPGSFQAGFVRYHERLMHRFAQQPANPEFHMELHVLRLGEIALCTNPFELFLDYGLRMKARSKAVQTFVVQLAAPADYPGYLPTARGLAGGHYSAQITDNWVGPEGGQVLVEETVAIINNLFA